MVKVTICSSTRLKNGARLGSHCFFAYIFYLENFYLLNPVRTWWTPNLNLWTWTSGAGSRFRKFCTKPEVQVRGSEIFGGSCSELNRGITVTSIRTCQFFKFIFLLGSMRSIIDLSTSRCSLQFNVSGALNGSGRDKKHREQKLTATHP